MKLSTSNETVTLIHKRTWTLWLTSSSVASHVKKPINVILSVTWLQLLSKKLQWNKALRNIWNLKLFYVHSKNVCIHKFLNIEKYTVLHEITFHWQAARLIYATLQYLHCRKKPSFNFYALAFAQRIILIFSF